MNPNCEILFTGVCYSCSDRRFKRSLKDVAGSDNVLDVITWFRQVHQELAEQGWHFLDHQGSSRPYCRACWERTEG